jgi:two-component system sporulation sensor kinase A
VAHEVRNPLNSIASLIEALFMELKLGEEYAEYQRHIQQQVDRLSKLMQDLMVVGHPVARRQLRIVDMRTLCRETVEGWNADRGGRGPLAVVEDSTPAAFMPGVLADQERLRDALINLLDNAAAHSPANSRLTVRLSLPEGEGVRLEVVDHGSGIPEEHLSRLFEPFFSLHRGGTGLGLNIVRTVVEALGGEVRVRNNSPEPGATAELRLPLAKPPPTIAPSA